MSESATTFGLDQLQTLTFELATDGVGVLRMNRPDRMNSQTAQMFAEYRTVGFALRDSGLRSLILTGTGERAFCAGFDMDEIDSLVAMGTLEFLDFVESSTNSIAGIRDLPFPVIAAIHGPAVGGGLALALAADIRLMAPTAKLSAAFIRLGLSVGELGTSWQLTRLVGSGRAAELGFTGRIVGAEEAVQIGLANRMVPAESLLDTAIDMAAMIARNSPGGVRMSKRAIQRNQEIHSYAAALELENRGQALLTRGADMPEALSAFKDKRTPRFTGR